MVIARSWRSRCGRLAAGLIEPNRLRRLAMGGLLILAVAIAFPCAGGMWTQPYDACGSVQHCVHAGRALYAALVRCLCSLPAIRFCSRRTGRCAFSGQSCWPDWPSRQPSTPTRMSPSSPIIFFFFLGGGNQREHLSHFARRAKDA